MLVATLYCGMPLSAAHACLLTRVQRHTYTGRTRLTLKFKLGVATQQLRIIMASASTLQEKELETKAINKCLDKLTDHLDINRVLDKLLSKELISAERHSEVAKLVEDGKRRQAVRNAMEEIGLKPPGSLKSFIEVLKEDEKTKYLGDHVAEGI